MSSEEWRHVKNYPGYMVSNYGEILGKNGKKLNGVINKFGYHTVVLFKDGKPRRWMVHRIVAETFIEDAKEGKEINHIDGNKKNNKVENLEWCTKKENIRHSVDILGRHNKAVRCIETGKTYKSVKEAATLCNSHGPNIIRACQNKSTAIGYHWAYVGGK